MADAYNVDVLRKSQTTFSWILGTRSKSCRFVIFKNFPWLATFKLTENGNEYRLCLHISPKVEWKLDLHVVIRYKQETKDFSLKGLSPFTPIFFNMSNYRLADITIKDLVEVTCSFLNILELIGPRFEIETQKNASTIVPTNVKHEDENTSREECESISSKETQKNASTIVPTNVKHEDENPSREECESISSKGKEENGKKDERISQEEKEENINSEIKEPVTSKGLVGLSENFKDAFLNEEYSDVILNVDDQKYPAHKVILMVRSPVFKAMLKHDMKEKREGVINISDCDPLIFRDFLLYIYTGKINDISNENVIELYQMSDKYEVKDLQTECVDFIFKHLSVDIICDVIALAARHCERALLSRATEFFTNHAQDILTTVQWQKFVQEHPVEANELFLKTFNKISGK